MASVTPNAISFSIERAGCSSIKLRWVGDTGSVCEASRSCSSVIPRFMVSAALHTMLSTSAGQFKTSRAASPHITLTSMACVALYMRVSVVDR